ncbi:Diacetylchitobiose uptake system permease protein NgcG [Paenibacillus auburnensis]|jgi:ABC-type glycerol-3-phosphate transport system permease component|uniref:Diacetylchitobiose uptake system permease protein NgcG n=1 Tax=Paenibacillus auburnensis TaxID=2905649 RepID=A0ABM9BR36_9BACL|nr:carbohydrate ABC transporter permease [Paenibacillus auburnensis]CAH1191706.1 Diacetylchitobiose uptake system permease protein NgcG [Paenibacillus auburnensis]
MYRLNRFLRQLPAQILLLVFTLIWSYPFIWIISSSFKSQSEMFLGGINIIPKEPTLDNFVRAWDLANFYQYFFNSVIVTASVVLLVLVLTSMAGYALGRGSMPGKKLIMTMLVMSMFLPKGFTILPLFELIVGLGFNNTLMGVILAESGPSKIVSILLFVGYFASLPKEMEESATIDGAGYFRMFFSIMLPLSKPILGTVTIFSFIGAWNAFFVPLTFTLSKPSLRTLGVGMYNFFGTNSVDWTGLAAGAVMSVVPIIIVFLFLQRYFIEGLAGSIKG